MVRRHTIPPRSRQTEGDGRGVDAGNSPDGGALRPEKPPETATDTAANELEHQQNVEREKTYGREQGGNQQGNQRGIGNRGDR